MASEAEAAGVGVKLFMDAFAAMLGASEEQAALRAQDDTTIQFFLFFEKVIVSFSIFKQIYLILKLQLYQLLQWMFPLWSRLKEYPSLIH